MNDDKNKIIETINIIRPYLLSEGGNIEFVDYKDNIVYIKMLGACASCAVLDMTVNDLIYSSLKEVVPNIERIEIV